MSPLLKSTFRNLFGRTTRKPHARPRRARPACEALEDRLVPSAALDLVGVTALRNDPTFRGIDGSGVSVAVIDSGLDRTHTLLSPGYRAGRDFVNNTDEPTPVSSHGTHVAGIVGARDPNIGVAPDVGLIGLQVFHRTNDGNVLAYGTDVAEALQWVLDNQARYNIVAVNMSLGGGFYTSPDQTRSDIRFNLVQRLEEAGVTVVSAAGNSFKGNETRNAGAPAIFSTLSIGSVWQDGRNTNIRWGSGAVDVTTGPDRIVSHSQRPPVDANTLFAPGALILSTVPNNGLEGQGGTSMASPLVAGVVALMQEAALQFGGRFLRPSEVRSILVAEANSDRIFDGDDENDNVANTNTAYRRVNAHKALQAVKQLFDRIAPPPPTPTPGVGTDPNGTIEGAYLGPRLRGAAVDPILGSIGTDGGTVQVGNKDVDMFRFEVASPGQVTIEVSTRPDAPRDFDSYLRLFDPSGRELANDDDGGAGTFSRLVANLSAGTYFVGLSAYDNINYDPNRAGSGVAAATGNYQLDFRFTNNDPNGLVSGAVPVNLGSDREPLTFNGNIGTDYGTPVGTADVDLFEVHVPDNGTLFVDIDTPSSNFVDSFLRVFWKQDNGTITEVGRNDDRRPPGDTQGHSTDSYLAITTFRGHTLLVGVSDYFNDSYNPSNLSNRPTLGDGGQYTLILTFANNDQNGSISQALNSSVIPLPVTNQLGRIGADTNFTTGQVFDVGDRDVDFVRINSPSAGILEIDVRAFAATDLPDDPVDAVLGLWDRDGNLLATNDDRSESDLDPFLQYTIAANTDYYVSVSGYGNDDFDPFFLGSGTEGGDTGFYRFNTRLRPAQDQGVLSDQVVGNGAVLSLSPGESVVSNLGADNRFATGGADVDLYRLVANTTQALVLRTETIELHSADTFLRFFDDRGQELAFNDNASDQTRSSLLRVNVTAGRTYFIGVSGAGAGARNYNPLTGEGAVAGSQGNYRILVEVATNNQAPTVGGLGAGPGRVLSGDTVALTAGGVGDADGTVAQVAFYRESNGVPGLQVGGDTLLGTDTQGGDGWSLGASTSGLATGNYFYYAVATDNAGAAGGAAVAEGKVVGIPLIPDQPAPANLAVAADVFANGREHFQDFVTKAYRRFLKREPDAVGLNAWVDLMLAKRVTDPQLEAGFLLSQEYVGLYGGIGRAWIVGMYNDLLGRTNPAPAEVDAWLQFIATPGTITFGFTASVERAVQQIRENYTTFLGRNASQEEVDAWVRLFLGGFTNEDMVRGFVGSLEYYQNPNKGRNNRARWLANAYNDVLFRDPSPAEVDAWLAVLAQG